MADGGWRRKTVSGSVLVSNGILAAAVVFLGGVGHLTGWGWMQEAGGQRLCVYSGSLLILQAAAYVTKRLWAREPLIRLLSSLRLPQLLQKERWAAGIYGAVLSVSIWAVILAGSFWPSLADRQGIVLPLLLVMVGIVWAMAQGEALSGQDGALAEEPKSPEEQAAAEERLVAFLAAWVVFMAAAIGALVWSVLKWHKYQWVFGDMPLKWQGDLVLAALGTAVGLLALVYGLCAKKRPPGTKK